jgi:hypothetical protein
MRTGSKIVAGVAIGGLVLFVWDYYSRNEEENERIRKLDEQMRESQRAVEAVQAKELQPTEVINEEWVVPAGSYQSVSFTVSASGPMHLEVQPVRHTEDGFSLGVVDPENLNACLGRTSRACDTVGGFQGPRVRAYQHTGEMEPGRWTFYVQNSENIFQDITVRVRLVLNQAD